MPIGRMLQAVFKPGQSIAVYAVDANINAGHFVTTTGKNAKGAYRGAHSAANAWAFGVAIRDCLADKTDHRGGTEVVRAPAVARVVAGAAINPTAAVVPIASDATGRAVPHTGTGPILGYAMSKVTAAGQIVEVALA